MIDPVVVIILLATAGLVLPLLVTVVLVMRARRSRDILMSAAAQRLELSYQSEDASIRQEPFAALRPVRVARSPRYRCVMRGSVQGLDVVFFDQWNHTPGGLSSIVGASMLALRAPGLSSPVFDACPRPRAAGFEPEDPARLIEPPEDPAFAQRYLVRGADREAVERLFDAELMAWFERRQAAACAGGEWVMVYRPWEPVSSDEVAALLEGAMELAEQIARRRA